MNEKASPLPPDFDGVFRFTNASDEPFTAKWNNIEYTFPPMSRTPMIISNASPEEVQQIRKKFAREWAIVQFYKTPKFVGLNTVAPGGIPALYTDADLAPFIQKCLDPLPEGRASAKRSKAVFDEEKLHKDDEGNPVSEVVKDSKNRFMKPGDRLVG